MGEAPQCAHWGGEGCAKAETLSVIAVNGADSSPGGGAKKLVQTWRMIKMSIILASASPRRKELLNMLGVKDLKILPAVGEEKADRTLPPDALVEALASHKAREVAAKCAASDIVIAADTIVWHDGRVYGKPHSEAEAADMLRALSGNAHAVYTGVSVMKDGRELRAAERSAVHFRALSEEEIAAYIQTGEPMDKAGAYGIQGRASLFVTGIEGDFFNVMGLPLCRLGLMLKELGVSLL